MKADRKNKKQEKKQQKALEKKQKQSEREAKKRKKKVARLNGKRILMQRKSRNGRRKTKKVPSVKEDVTRPNQKRNTKKRQSIRRSL